MMQTINVNNDIEIKLACYNTFRFLGQVLKKCNVYSIKNTTMVCLLAVYLLHTEYHKYSKIV